MTGLLPCGAKRASQEGRGCSGTEEAVEASIRWRHWSLHNTPVRLLLRGRGHLSSFQSTTTPSFLIFPFPLKSSPVCISITALSIITSFLITCLLPSLTLTHPISFRHRSHAFCARPPLCCGRCCQRCCRAGKGHIQGL